MSDETVPEQPPMYATGAWFKFSLAMAVSRIAVPASIITVRTYDGETEGEALERHGIDRHPPGAELHFLHLT